MAEIELSEGSTSLENEFGVSHFSNETEAKPNETMSNIHDNGASLPNVEDLKLEAASSRTPSTAGRQKKFWIIVAGTVIAISGLVAIVVSIQERKNVLMKTKINTSKVDSTADWNDVGVLEPEHESLQNVRSDSRLGDVMDFLSASITESVIFEDEYSPQYKAARWLADQDFAFVEIPDADPKDYNETFWFVQRYVLAVFYFSLGGENWRYKSYFMSDYDVCDWSMLFQADQPPEGIEETQWTFGVQCNEGGEVTDIMFTSNGLEGVLPAEIADLLSLGHISLFDNKIRGNFPERMKALQNLEFLSLEQNELSGPLPSWMNQWASLEFLNLGSNKLNGQLPDFFGMNNLIQIALDSNDLTGPIDNLGVVPTLQSIFLNDNDFSGPFGEDTWEDLPNLVSMDLSNNYLTGYVPRWVYDMERVDLHMNFLNATGIPDVGRANSPLEYFSIFGNDIEGRIPESLTNLAALSHLDLSDNFLTGYIPDDIFYLQNLINLYLTDNDFDFWQIPDLSASTWLQELGLADCNLNGTIPQWFGALTDLQLLDLRDNELTGPIPEELGLLYDMEWLLLNRNYLTGPIPDSLGDLPNIVTLFLDNNDLVGSVEQVCQARPDQLTQLMRDCNVECSCCTECCKEGGDEECNNWVDTFRLSVEQERDDYVFSEDLIFNTGTNNAE